MKFKEYFLLESVDWDNLKYVYSEDVENDCRRITIVQSSGQVGYIEWSMDDGEVVKIYVSDKLRRKGVASHLWEYATDYSENHNYAPPEHSSRRSYEGEMFAQSVGGHVPRLTDDIDGWSSR